MERCCFCGESKINKEVHILYLSNSDDFVLCYNCVKELYTNQKYKSTQTSAKTQDKENGNK